jgi:DNA-binding transcriptional MerR regulator
MGRWMRPVIVTTTLGCLFVTLHCYGQSTPQVYPSGLTIEEIRSRLDLTAEQQQQITPLATEYRKRMSEIRANLEKTRSRQSRRGLLLQAAAIQEGFHSTLAPLLTDEQRAEWKTIRDEMRDELKQRWHAK